MLRNFPFNFQVSIYIQKAWHLVLRDVFTYKERDNSQKARQFALRFYMQKYRQFALRGFYGFFLN